MPRVPVYSRSGDTSPIVGQLPTWRAAYKTSDWTAFTTPPSFVELSRGWYYFDVPATSFVGLIDFGAGSKPEFAVYYPEGFGIAVALDANGAPLELLSPVWDKWYSDVNTSDTSGAPSIVEVGDGLYRFDPSGITTHAVGTIDFGATALQRYVPWNNGGSASGDVTAPEIKNFSPPKDGSVKIGRDQFLEFDVTDNGSFKLVALFASYPDGSTQMVHDGDNFRDAFARSSYRTTISGGFHYRVKPEGGWQAAPSIEYLVVDASGNVGVFA